MNTIFSFIYFAVMGLLFSKMLKNLCYSCGVDVLIVYGVVRKMLFYTLYALLACATVWLCASIVLLFY